jgi:hypothetical protein
MAAGGEGPVEQGEVADAAVRWQVVEAAGIVDQVVRAAQVGRGEGEGIAAMKVDLGAGIAGAVLGPGDGRWGKVHGVHRESRRGEVHGVAAGATA